MRIIKLYRDKIFFYTQRERTFGKVEKKCRLLWYILSQLLIISLCFSINFSDNFLGIVAVQWLNKHRCLRHS